MDTMPSSEFRLHYAKLTQPTVVTVNGHPIGRWSPITAAGDMELNASFDPHSLTIETSKNVTSGYSSRPFTPVPKTKSR